MTENTQKQIQNIDKTIKELETLKKGLEKKDALEEQIQKWKDSGLDDESVQTLVEHHPSKVGEGLTKVNKWLDEHKDLIEFIG